MSIKKIFKPTLINITTTIFLCLMSIVIFISQFDPDLIYDSKLSLLIQKGILYFLTLPLLLIKTKLPGFVGIVLNVLYIYVVAVIFTKCIESLISFLRKKYKK